MDRSENSSRVFVVVLNYRGWRETIECLESIYRGSYRQFEMVVVDNSSCDESLLRIRDWARSNNILMKHEIHLRAQMPASYPDSPFRARALTLIETEKNRGFSAGNNRGIEYALASRADFILLLNNDTLLEESTVETLVQAIQSNKRIGAVFPLVLGTGGEIQVPVYLRPPRTFAELLLACNVPGVILPRYRYRSYLKRKNPYPDYRYDRMIAVPNIAIAGGALFRRELFQEVGLLDENLFMYYEEDILMRKLERTNWLVFMEPLAKLVHKGGVDNSKLSSAFLYTKRVCGEMYYVRHFMKLPFWQQGLLKLLRVGGYCYFVLAGSKDYCTSFSEFSREYVFG